MNIENKNGEFVKEHSILLPFSPPIYETVLNANDLKFIQEYAELSRTAFHVGDMLSGNIAEQRGSDIENDEMREKMIDILLPHIQEYFKICQIQERQQLPQLEKEKNNPLPDYSKIKFHLGNGTWFNFMRANEFNPLHCHSGVINGIVMVQIPEEISSEVRTVPMASNARCPGQLEWVHGSWGAGAYRKYPVTGELYMFPAQLRHQVYPFTSDVERITMSWNVFDIKFD